VTAVAESSRLITVEPRGAASLWIRILISVLSVIAAALVGALLLAATGHSPIDAYKLIYTSGFGNQRVLARTMVLAVPLILTALAAAIPFRMKLWNIGAEGQLYIGAIAGSGVVLALGDSIPAAVQLPAMMVAGAVGGALWAGLAALPKAYLNTDEVISTLMLNFVALGIMNYLIFGSASFWRDTERMAFPVGRHIPDAAALPRIWGPLHAGILIAVVLAIAVWVLLRSTRWGFELRVIGRSPRAARYAGMRVDRKMVSVLVISGALAGLAGAIEVSGPLGGLDPVALSIGMGFTGIVVAAVARLSPLGILPVAVLIAGLIKSASSLQTIGVPIQIAVVLQGLLFLFVVGGEFFLVNRVRLNLRRMEVGS
jgi:simple sugar transport system permease protein